MNSPIGSGLLASARQHVTKNDPELKLVGAVYCLWHEHEVNPGDYTEKLLGFYSSCELAEQARDRLVKAPGFADCPEGFIIDAYELDRDHWTEGYLTVD